MYYPWRRRSDGGAPKDPSPVRLLLAICLGEREEARVFGAWQRRRQRKLWPMKRLRCRWSDLLPKIGEMNQLRAPAWPLLLGLIEGHMGKKTEGESADSRCADEKVKS